MIGCILMASGFGRRFGGNKLLAEVNGVPLYRRAFDLLAALEGTETVVVSQYPALEQAARARGFRAVHNPDAAEGISASLRYGVAALPDAEWYACFVADQPYLTPEAVNAFLRAARASGKTLASLTDGKRPGNPCLFRRVWREELLSLRGDTGGRRILRAHPEEVFWYTVPERLLVDIDTR